jgi:ATP-dependent RNA helicase SUPV3L1/SUV3
MAQPDPDSVSPSPSASPDGPGSLAPKDLFSTLEPLLPLLAREFNAELALLSDTRLFPCRDARRGIRRALHNALADNGFGGMVYVLTGEAASVRNLSIKGPPAARALWLLLACASSSVAPAIIYELLCSRPVGETAEWDASTIAGCHRALDELIRKRDSKNTPRKSRRPQNSNASPQQQLDEARNAAAKQLKREQKAELQRKAAESRKRAEDQRLERERLAKLAAQEKLVEILASLCSQSPCPLTALAFRELQAQHKALFDEALTLPKCMKRYGLPKDARQRIDEELEVLSEQERIERENRAKQMTLANVQQAVAREWDKSLLHTCDMQKLLGITTTERDCWIKEEVLYVAQYREFSKWRKTFKTPYFDPVHLKKFTPSCLQKLRDKHAKAVTKTRSTAGKKAAVKTAKTREIKRVLNINNYEAQFSAARDLGREWHLCLGPTNSGKTHAAMQALAQAKSGVYLAPLRLLALENYERLKAKGIAVNLLTGEERIFDPLAKHTCATVEMCDFTTVVDVAVIDEVQMLTDPQRGWAWTPALLGVPAQKVYACGAPHAHDALHQLAGICYETCTVQEFSRLVPLEVAKMGVTLDQVQAGDAVIAFSRREVLQFARILKGRGLGVSVIYGALSPEVRRSQAQAFIEGRTQVVVATDAIGMGVNLPIKRIVFSALSKYDGESNRGLTSLEIRQIAGRAGRYGLAEQGVVTGFSSGYLSRIASGLHQPVPSFEAPYSVMPTWEHVATVLDALKTKDVGKAFEFFARIKFGGQFVQADLTDCLARYAELAQTRRPIEPKDMFMLCCAPADPRNIEDMDMLRGAAYSLLPDYVLPIPKASFDLSKKEPSGHELKLAEAYSRELALFSWVACKWPYAVLDNGLAELRSMTAEFIDRALLTHREAFVSKRKRRYGWRDEDRDDGGYRAASDREEFDD